MCQKSDTKQISDMAKHSSQTNHLIYFDKRLQLNIITGENYGKQLKLKKYILTI